MGKRRRQFVYSSDQLQAANFSIDIADTPTPAHVGLDRERLASEASINNFSSSGRSLTHLPPDALQSPGHRTIQTEALPLGNNNQPITISIPTSTPSVSQTDPSLHLFEQKIERLSPKEDHNPTPLSSLPHHRLTHSDLVGLQTVESPSDSAKFPPPFDRVPRNSHIHPLTLDVDADANKSSGTHTSMSNSSHGDELLNDYRIFMDQGLPFPQELSSRVTAVRKARPLPITLKSKKIASMHIKTKTQLENTAMFEIVSKLLYECKMNEQDPDDDGEPMVERAFDTQWKDLVPKPVGGPKEVEKLLQEAMEKLGGPKIPKPDFYYGYPDSALDEVHIAVLKAWYPDVLVLDRAPWFPYQVGEWKGKGQTIAAAEAQARTDSAEVIDTMHRFCVAAGVKAPSVKATCAFSTCIDANLVILRLHWRQTDGIGMVSYHAEKIYTALLENSDMVFQMRGMLLNILDWVRGDRLRAIREALKNVKKPQPSKADHKKAADKECKGEGTKSTTEGHGKEKGEGKSSTGKSSSPKASAAQSSEAHNSSSSEAPSGSPSKKRKGSSS